MSNIDVVNKNFLNQNLKTGKDHELKKNVQINKNGESPSIQSRKLLIELNLSIQIESKEQFGTQSGMNIFSQFSDIDLSQFSYNGKPITQLSQDEAKNLISENGFFGIENTAKRIFDFAVNIAGDDLEKLKVARDAVIKGFKDAEKLFGGKLPEISYATFDKTIESIDKKIIELGGSIVDISA